MEFIIDISSHYCGRTIRIKARNVRIAYDEAKKTLDESKCEKISQIRDESGTIYYTWDRGFGNGKMLWENS